MKRIRSTLCCLTLTILVLCSLAVAAPVQWAGNDHYYEAVSVPAGVSWTEAAAAATGAGGYLATLTTSSENDFVFGLIDAPLYWNQEPGGSNLGPWLGAYQTFDDGTMPDANWRWVTSEAFDYTNWHAGEPNNFTGADEDYLSFKCWGTDYCRINQWNDLPNNISVYGTSVVAYVVEYDDLTPAADFPAPGCRLLANVPNPFNPRTTLRFDLPDAMPVSLRVYDIGGRLVDVLLNDEMAAAGRNEIIWCGTDRTDRHLASGTYFYRLEARGQSQTKRMTLLR